MFVKELAKNRIIVSDSVCRRRSLRKEFGSFGRKCFRVYRFKVAAGYRAFSGRKRFGKIERGQNSVVVRRELMCHQDGGN